MIISAIMAGFDRNAKRQFDGLFYYFKEHPSSINSSLMSWYQNICCEDAQGTDAATDGDIDIAYALLLADKQWGSCGSINYKQEALKIINAIRKSEMDKTMSYPLLGDWVEPSDKKRYNSTRTSDFILAQFRSFASASSDPRWLHLVESIYSIIGKIQKNESRATGLLPDFVVKPMSDPKASGKNFLESVNDGDYYYNACRVPMRLGIDYLISGDMRMHDALEKMNSWIKKISQNDPHNIMAGYTLNGTPVDGSDYQTMAFIAPFAVSAMADAGNQEWLNRLWTMLVTAQKEEYYEDTIRLLTMIVVSGNWWVPEKMADVCQTKQMFKRGSTFHSPSSSSS
jgi:endo-1,4-beta-D-glucanase Y